MWTNKDLKWLKEKYPAIKKVSKNRIEGRLSFQMIRLNGQYFVDPSADQIQQTNLSDFIFLGDSYEIAIEWNDSKNFPKAYEIGGKIKRVAAKLEKSEIDMHMYPIDSSLCLAAPMQLDIEQFNGLTLEKYIEEFLIPYLFAQTYYARKQVWLWGDLSHGIMGLLEWLGRKKDYIPVDAKITHLRLTAIVGTAKGHIRELLSIRCRNHKPCPCGSGKKTRNCHPDVQQGIARLRSAISSNVINIL